MSTDAPDPENWSTTRDEAVRHIEQGDYAAATKLLEGAAANRDGERDGLLGLAHFHREQFADAVPCFEAAVAAAPDNEEWQHLLGLARANTAAAVEVLVPDLHYFDRETLLAPPTIGPAALPTPPISVRLSLWHRVGDAIGDVVGKVGGWLMHRLTALHGRVSGYRDEVWTNWYRRSQLRAVLTLAYMRDRLNADNLKSTYPPGAKIGFLSDGLSPPEGVTHFRTADGTWNNLDDPMEGAAGTRFPRNVANDSIRPADDDALLEPNPRLISLELLTRGDEMKEVPFLNLLAAVWIQFQNHDWITHGDNLLHDLHEIPLPEHDPARKRFRQTKMFAAKTQPDPTRHAEGEETPSTYINEVTHWWDGSQIYGSDQETQNALRSFVDGKLRLNEDGTLPVDDKGVEMSGMVRNWWVGLSMLHDLFAREHNAICNHLMEHHPDWEDNRLFNVARLVNAAVMAKIHTVEWTPAILPNKVLNLALNANWYGLLTYKWRQPENRKTVATINVHNPELGGVVGNKLNKHGSPYGLTEEFVEVYRLHSLLPETLRFRSHETDELLEEVPFPASRLAGSPPITERIGMVDLFYSFGNQHPGQLVLNNFPRFMQELAVPGNPMFDMGAIDLLRARERGVPRYNEFRRQLGLNPIRSFADLTDDEHYRRKLAEIYGEGSEGVERLDLLIGTLAETNRPTAFGFGETMFQIFILNATRRLQADRFYTDDYREEVYTKEGLRWVDESSFKKVILRHFPELERSGLGNIKNAFEPWDIQAELDPSRHPLREYDPDLKHPWRGDAAGTLKGRRSAMSEGAVPGEGWQERLVGGTDEGEADEFRRLAAEIQKIQRKLAKHASSDRGYRAQHAKIHAGFTDAVFRVDSDLPPGLAAGIFRPAAEYEACVRFSNASGLIRPDPEPDLRGLAFRVFSGEENQVPARNDFLMTNAPVSHARDPGQFVAFASANTANSKLVMVFRLILAVGPREAIRILKNLSAATTRPVRSLADESYWSRAPFQLGRKAVRYHVRRADDGGLARSDDPGGTSSDYLREELERRLKAGPVVFDFLVQRYVDEETTPIEDGAAPWPEADAPPVRIAQLHIPKQDLAAPEAVAATETVDALTFSPWNGAETLRPLGALNRARRPVYAASQDLRT